METRST